MVTSYCELLEALTGREILAAGQRVDLGDSVGFTGTWEVLHAGACVRRIMRQHTWDEIGELATFTCSPHLNGLRLEGLLLATLIAAGRPEGVAERARVLAATSDERLLPLPGIEARLVLAELEQSAEHAYDALAPAAQHGLVLAQIDAIELLAVAAHRAGDTERAARLKAAALGERDRIGYRFRWPSRDAAFEAVDVPNGTPADSLADAVAYAQRGRGDHRREAFGWASLTPTELDVAERVATGLTNPQVAEQLHVGTATVKTHLEHIYTKLGINSRTELAAEVTRRA